MAYKVAIDANAGGINSGNTANGIIEKDYTLLISKYISDRLNEFNIENFLVRSEDETLSDEDESAFVKVHDNNFIKAKKRL